MPGHWIIPWAMLALVPGAVAADSQSADIDARFAAMQAQIEALSQRLEQLDQKLRSRAPHADITADTIGTRPPAVPPRPQSGPAFYQDPEVLHANWKQLQRGLSRSGLRQLLGKPDSELAIDRQTLWYYRYPGIGSGSVMLDSNNKVTGWQLPPFRGW